MAYERPTVAIRRASGKRSVIALEDYDPVTMTLWDAPQPVAPAPPAAPLPPAPSTQPASSERVKRAHNRRGR